MRIDKRDTQIMEVLAQNCRVSDTSLAKALRVSKDTVRYRIKQLEEANLIEQYVLFVDARRLGFTRYHLLVRFDTGLTKKEETYQKIAKHPFVMWINTFLGRYDIQIIVDATDGFHLDKIRSEIFELCDHQIKEYSILTHLSDLEFTQLNPVLDLGTVFDRKDDQSFSRSLTTRNFPVAQKFTQYSPTKTEAKILNILADNPRASLTEVGRLAGCERQTAKKKISHLIDKKIILNFGGIPNLSRLGFVTYYLLVRVVQDTPMRKLKKPFQELRNIFYAGKMSGDYDMILYLNARTPQELNESIELFKSELGDCIIHYDLLVQDKVHHWRQFTEGIFQKI